MCSAPRRAGSDAVTAFHASVTQLTESRTSNPVDASSNLAGGFFSGNSIRAGKHPKHIPPVYLTYPLVYAIMQSTSDRGSRKQAAALRSYLKGANDHDTFRYEQSVQPQ